MMKRYPELTSPIKANYPQLPRKILNRQFMQVVSYRRFTLSSATSTSTVFSSCHLSSLNNNASSCLKSHYWNCWRWFLVSSTYGQKIIFPNGGLYTLFYGFSTTSSLNWERERERTGFFLLQFERTQMLNDQNFPLDSQWGVNGTVWRVSLSLEQIDKNIVFSQLEPQKLLNHHHVSGDLLKSQIFLPRKKTQKCPKFHR